MAPPDPPGRDAEGEEGCRERRHECGGAQRPREIHGDPVEGGALRDEDIGVRRVGHELVLVLDDDRGGDEARRARSHPLDDDERARPEEPGDDTVVGDRHPLPLLALDLEGDGLARGLDDRSRHDTPADAPAAALGVDLLGELLRRDVVGERGGGCDGGEGPDRDRGDEEERDQPPATGEAVGSQPVSQPAHPQVPSARASSIARKSSSRSSPMYLPERRSPGSTKKASGRATTP